MKTMILWLRHYLRLYDNAAPYYRIFNANTQTARFDSTHKYIRTWLPEHNELDYPAPIVDLASSREHALQRYRQNITSWEFLYERIITGRTRQSPSTIQ